MITKNKKYTKCARVHWSVDRTIQVLVLSSNACLDSNVEIYTFRRYSTIDFLTSKKQIIIVELRASTNKRLRLRS